MTEKNILGFLFLSLESKWSSLKGAKASTPLPKGTFFTFLAMPGKLCASGKTEAEAEKRLQAVIEYHFEKRGNAAKWYAEKLSEMTAKEREGLFCLFGEAQLSKAANRPATRADGIVYVKEPKRKFDALSLSC